MTVGKMCACTLPDFALQAGQLYSLPEKEPAMRSIAAAAALAILFLPALVRGQEPVKSVAQLNTSLKGDGEIAAIGPGFGTLAPGTICPVCVLAQETPETQPAFRLLSAKNTEKLQQELDRASGEGYAVVLAWPGHDCVILKKRTTDSPSVYRVGNGKKAVEEVLAHGHRAVADTLDVNRGALLVVAMATGQDEQYESLLLQTNRTSTLEKELRDARAKGFHVIGMASDDSGHAVLLERLGRDGLSLPGPDTIALIAANRQDTLQKELADRAAAGFTIAQASSWRETVLTLERSEGDTPIEYRVLSTTRASTLENEMNAAAGEGYRFTSGTLHAQQKGGIPGFGRMGSEYLAIMEKRPGTGPTSEYVVVSARRMATLTREFDDAVAKGLVPVALAIGYSDQETLVLFERQRATGGRE